MPRRTCIAFRQPADISRYISAGAPRFNYAYAPILGALLLWMKGVPYGRICTVRSAGGQVGGYGWFASNGELLVNGEWEGSDGLCR